MWIWLYGVDNKMKRQILAAIAAVGLSACTFQAAAQSVSVFPAGGRVSMLVGQGGNVAVSVGEDGTLMVDDQFAYITEDLLMAIDELGGDEPRYVINTHYHGDHTGGNENLGDGGAAIVAHDNVRKRLQAGATLAAFNVEMPPKAGTALPSITYDSGMTLHINGEAVRLIHVDNAHTDGDTLVYFTGSNVIHMGDTFFNGFFPFIDTAHGGTLAGMIAAARLALSLGDDDTVVIPGHGPLSNKTELRAFRDMLITANARLSKEKAAGRPLLAVLKANPLADLDAQWGNALFTAERWIQIIYDRGVF